MQAEEQRKRGEQIDRDREKERDRRRTGNALRLCVAIAEDLACQNPNGRPVLTPIHNQL